MSSLFTNYFAIQNAKNFERFLTYPFGSLYVTMGRVLDWPNGDTPPTPTQSANTFYDYWNNLVAAKRITAADMNLVVPRVDWVSGNTYIAYSQDLDLFKKTSSDQILYDYQFYVRTSKDQVFKCLANNFTANTQTAKSTVMPEISVGGQLPENPYLSTSDGYKWKYLFTIPAELKQKFFTRQFMPVVSDPSVTKSATGGRLDVFKITTQGAGYNSNTSASSLKIVTVNGDGSGADLSIKVTQTPTPGGANVTDVNVIQAGSGYTKATVSLNDPGRISTQDAVIVPIIGPPGGHGSDIERELGASNIMVSVDINGDEEGTFPVSAYETHGIRQIGLLLDPKVYFDTANGTAKVTATDSKIRATNKYILTNYNTFLHDEMVYQGSVSAPTFSGIVEHFSNGDLYLTNIFGTPDLLSPVYGAISAASGFIATQEPSTFVRYSGKLLYIEDTSEILRSIEQTTQFKFTLRF